MDDEAYARELLAILTNPTPAGIDADDPYGQAVDGVDRYDGFGRDVWVESLVVEAGEHGAELVVSFRLAVPPDPAWRGTAERGSVRLPFDQRWRRLSGYEGPAAYAPTVAREVELAAHEQVERHRAGAVRTRRSGTGRSLPNRDVQWKMLLDALAAEGTVREIGRGRIALEVLGDVDSTPGDLVTVVVSPEQWERVLAERAGGDAGLYIAEVLGPRDEDERFVIFFDGDLVRSTREELPPVRGRAFERRIAEARATHPGGPGSWSAHVSDIVDDSEPPSNA
jgi:hypothetical protein